MKEESSEKKEEDEKTETKDDVPEDAEMKDATSEVKDDSAEAKDTTSEPVKEEEKPEVPKRYLLFEILCRTFLKSIFTSCHLLGPRKYRFSALYTEILQL